MQIVLTPDLSLGFGHKIIWGALALIFYNCSMENLGLIAIIQKTGDEPLSFNNEEIGIKLLDFWRWSASDLVSNATRGRFAEFIVASALGIDTTIVRDEWSAYDLESKEGVKIEVKSAAYIQSWNQKRHSAIRFSIKATRNWNAAKGLYENEIKRQADIYVFCLLKHIEQHTLNPLDISQWDFYVCPSTLLNITPGNAKGISLKRLKKIAEPIAYNLINATIVNIKT